MIVNVCQGNPVEFGLRLLGGELEPPNSNDILEYYATTLASHVGQFWQRHMDALGQTLRSVAGVL